MAKFSTAVLLSLALISLSGCGNRQAQLVGSWKAQAVDMSNRDSMSDAFKNWAAGFVMRGSTLEFNQEGKVKLTFMSVSTKGSYEIQGSTIKVQFDPPHTDTLELTISDDGKELRLKQEFPSDPLVTFEKETGSASASNSR